VTNVEVLDQCDGHFAPYFDEAGEEIGVIDIEGAIEADGEGDSVLLVIHFEIGQVGVRQGSGQLVSGEMLKVYAIKAQKVGELDVVDGAETIELEDAGDRIGIFDLRKPGIGDVKLGIAFGFGNLLAEVGNFTRGDAQTATDVFELFAGGLGWGPSHAKVYLKTVK
jgi:hypothetical protein